MAGMETVELKPPEGQEPPETIDIAKELKQPGELPIKTTPAEEKACPTCGLDLFIMALGTAHSSCGVIDDPVKKNECIQWAESIDPEEFESSVEMVIDTMKRTGLAGPRRSADAFNLIIREAVLRLVPDMIERGEPVPDDMMKAYKQALMEHGV